MTKNEVPLGKYKVSKNYQIYIVSKARPYFPDLKPGDFVEFVLDVASQRVFIRKAKKEKVRV